MGQVNPKPKVHSDAIHFLDVSSTVPHSRELDTHVPIHRERGQTKKTQTDLAVENVKATLNGRIRPPKHHQLKMPFLHLLAPSKN
jgi:hypothetical protein